MLAKQTATVVKVKKGQIVLKLADGQKIKWSKDKLPEEAKEGEVYNIFLSSSQNLLNEIIDGKKK